MISPDKSAVPLNTLDLEAALLRYTMLAGVH
jgi:hypothetical protein